MKSIASLVFLGLFAFVAADGFDLDLDALSAQLENAPLVDVEESRTRNVWRKSSASCECFEDNSCQCCASPKVFGIPISGCFSFKFDAEEKLLTMELNALKKNVFKAKISTKKLERLCGHLPGKASFLGFCLFTKTTETEDDGLVSCSHLNVYVKETTAAEVSFTCVSLKEGRISFDIQHSPSQDSPLKIKVKNPLKVAVDFIKNQIKKEQAPQN